MDVFKNFICQVRFYSCDNIMSTTIITKKKFNPLDDFITTFISYNNCVRIFV